MPGELPCPGSRHRNHHLLPETLCPFSVESASSKLCLLRVPRPICPSSGSALGKAKKGLEVITAWTQALSEPKGMGLASNQGQAKPRRGAELNERKALVINWGLGSQEPKRAPSWTKMVSSCAL